MREQRSKQDIWSYSWQRSHDTPLLGSYHGSDMLNMFGGGELTTFVLNFINHLDPNGESGPEVWPKHTAESPVMLAFFNSTTEPLSRSVIEDTYREEAMDFVTNLFTKYPLTQSSF